MEKAISYPIVYETAKEKRSMKDTKAVVKYNATKHGLTSLTPVIEKLGERQEDYEALREEVHRSLEPQDGLEESLPKTLQTFCGG